jgi:hypothetical protein
MQSCHDLKIMKPSAKLTDTFVFGVLTAAFGDKISCSSTGLFEAFFMI